MRFAYLDESGTHDDGKVAVVAGAIIHADSQWKSLARYIERIKADYLPEYMRANFIFHAKDLVHGNKKKRFSREYGWPKERRWPILHALLKAPSELTIPIAFGFVTKDSLQEKTPQAREIEAQVLAYAFCIVCVEAFMRNTATHDEVANVIAEDKNGVRGAIKKVHHRLMKPGAWAEIGADVMKLLPLERVVDTVHFASKSESILLQLADACAWAYRRDMDSNVPYSEFFSTMVDGHMEHSAQCNPNKKYGYEYLMLYTARGGPVRGYGVSPFYKSLPLRSGRLYRVRGSDTDIV